MNQRPIILVTPFLVDLAVQGDLPTEGVKTSYLKALLNAGADPLVAPFGVSQKTLERLCDFSDGLLIPGGCDVNPAFYGEQPTKESKGPFCDERDALELSLIKIFTHKKKPIFGICRGLQILNVSRGGTLHQDIKTEIPSGLCHRDPKRTALEQYFEDAHETKLSEGSALRGIFGKENIPVNSIHHQSVKKLGEGLKANATAPDGVIEGAESEDMSAHWVLGVQWHPETLREKHSEQNELFKKFVEATKNTR